jgi:hypothetical protein
MTDGGSKSESEEEPVLFTNTDQPLEDPTIAPLEMKVRMRKKDVTSCVTKIGETVKIIQKAATGGSSSGNNMVVKGYITAGAGHIEKAQHALERVEKQIGKLEYLIEQVGLQFPGKIKDEVAQKLNKLEDDMQSYRTKVSDIVESSIEHFKDETVASAPASAESSRGNSPNRKRFLKMKHLMPNTLASECTILEYCKFKRDFTAWLYVSYPEVYLRSEMWTAFMSRADAGWQQRADTTR